MRNNRKRICGAVTIFNPPGDVHENILTYIKQIEKLYVVDNTDGGSDKKILKKIKSLRKVEIISNGENLGIAAAMNRACKRAVEEGYDFVLTMDHDSRAPENMVGDLFRFASENGYDLPGVGIIGPFPYDRANPSIPEADVEETVYVLTSGSVMNMKAYVESGGFCEKLFIDRVDDEYCLRLKKMGYSVLRVNRVLLDHNLGDISEHTLFGRKQIVTNHSVYRRYYITRNLFFVSKKYGKLFPDYAREQRRTFFFDTAKLLLFEDEKFRKIKSILTGFLDYKKGRFGKFESIHGLTKTV